MIYFFKIFTFFKKLWNIPKMDSSICSFLDDKKEKNPKTLFNAYGNENFCIQLPRRFVNSSKFVIHCFLKILVISVIAHSSWKMCSALTDQRNVAITDISFLPLLIFYLFSLVQFSGTSIVRSQEQLIIKIKFRILYKNLSKNIITGLAVFTQNSK